MINTEGGRIYLGITDTGIVEGITLNLSQVRERERERDLAGEVRRLIEVTGGRENVKDISGLLFCVLPWKTYCQ